jgi:hypothetical protein
MTESQLTEYQKLWQTKNQIAREQAIGELQGLRKETSAEISKIKDELSQLGGVTMKIGFEVADVEETGEETLSYLGQHFTQTKDMSSKAWGEVRDDLKATWGRIGEQSEEGWKKITATIQGQVAEIRKTIDDLVDKGHSWGSNLISEFTRGLDDGFGRLRDKLAEMAEMVSGYVGFSSPTELGPGRDADKWAPNFMEMFAKGITDNMALVQDAVSQVAGQMQPQTTTNNYHSSTGGPINITVQDGEDLLRMLQRLGVRF